MTTELSKKQFSDLLKVKNDGLVFRGCGDNLNEWVTGISDILKEQNITCNFGEKWYLTTSGGRTDLVFPFDGSSEQDISKLAIWRIQFGDCSWISDYIDNYRDHHI